MFKTEDISYLTDCYFNKSRRAAEYAGLNPKVIWQVFQKKESIFCGGYFLPEILKHVDEAWSLQDGDAMLPGETAMILKGSFQDFVQFETVYLGILARCTRIATNVREAVVAANKKTVLFFPGRFDIPEAQVYDGYAASVGGAHGAATADQTEGMNLHRKADYTKGGPLNPVGTMPHALIAAFGGDTVAAALAFAESHTDENIWVLVDFHNTCVTTALEVAKAFRDKGMLHRLTGVRLDTSEKLIDRDLETLFRQNGDAICLGHYGVSPDLTQYVRASLNEAGFQDVKICVSGGFTPEKIRIFESHFGPNTPNVYAIGEGFLRGSNAFTSDIVARYNGSGSLIPCAKIGRELKPNPRLKRL